MRNRPRSITIISWIFLAAGVVGFAYHVTEFKKLRPFDYDVAWVCFVRLLAILCGVFMLRGRNWARWLLLVWIGYHVALSVLHTPFELVVHSLLFAVVAYFLFRPQAAAYFRGTTTPPKNPKLDDTRAA
jgi:formate hydrogenlyase subunit 3/multisubunit Na+/H+ antiporter MnhD subunit